MQRVTEFLFEALMVKQIHRTGYQFLGTGKESVAEHTFAVMCIAWTMAQLIPEADGYRLLSMCLVHDLPEARMGDLNHVQKQYVTPDEDLAVDHMIRSLPFDTTVKDLIQEFNAGETLEAKLARDADQLAFLFDLKSLSDLGYTQPEKWSTHVTKRIVTDLGVKIAKQVGRMETDCWWYKGFDDHQAT